MFTNYICMIKQYKLVTNMVKHIIAHEFFECLNYIDGKNIIDGMTGVCEWRNV